MTNSACISKFSFLAFLFLPSQSISTRKKKKETQWTNYTEAATQRHALFSVWWYSQNSEEQNQWGLESEQIKINPPDLIFHLCYSFPSTPIITPRSQIPNTPRHLKHMFQTMPSNSTHLFQTLRKYKTWSPIISYKLINQNLGSQIYQKFMGKNWCFESNLWKIIIIKKILHDDV